MIISASRRTDVPAFFGEWFVRRLEDGYVVVRNPMNHSQIRRVDLTPQQVECIVFWTKDPEPFLAHLPRLDAMGYTYYFQYTLNPYPADIEGGLPALSRRTASFKRLAEHVGPKRVVWRYDPIIFAPNITLEWHQEHYGCLAEQLKGYSERCVISFVDFYQKTLRNTKHLGLRPPVAEERDSLCRFIGEAGRASGFTVSACCEDASLAEYGISRASCVDAGLIAEITGRSCPVPRDRNQRPGCGCAQSIDVGVYNTCSHLCAYCYANTSSKAVRQNILRHDPHSPVLIGSIAEQK